MTLLNFGFTKYRDFDHPWWIQIQTQVPRCTYYFGPFESSREAQLRLGGYVEDLMAEGAHGIDASIDQNQPRQLTIDEEEASPSLASLFPPALEVTAPRGAGAGPDTPSPRPLSSPG